MNTNPLCVSSDNEDYAWQAELEICSEGSYVVVFSFSHSNNNFFQSKSDTLFIHLSHLILPRLSWRFLNAVRLTYPCFGVQWRVQVGRKPGNLIMQSSVINVSWLHILLLRGGDIESNPGPFPLTHIDIFRQQYCDVFGFDLDEVHKAIHKSQCKMNFIHSKIKQAFRILCWNMDGWFSHDANSLIIYNRIYDIPDFYQYDCVILTETHVNKLEGIPEIPNFVVWHNQRKDHQNQLMSSGGVAIAININWTDYVLNEKSMLKEDVLCIHFHQDFTLNEINNICIVGVHVPPITSRFAKFALGKNKWDVWNNIHSTLATFQNQGFHPIIAGDFNATTNTSNTNVFARSSIDNRKIDPYGKKLIDLIKIHDLTNYT